MTLSVDEFERFSKEWNDARCRVTGGRYGEKMKTLDAEKTEKKRAGPPFPGTVSASLQGCTERRERKKGQRAFKVGCHLRENRKRL